MTKIEPDIKLDYSDVLLAPSESKINSRKDIDLTIPLRNGTRVVPIVAANMDHVGTFEMAKEFAKHKIMTALVKHYSNLEISNFLNENPLVAPYIFVSMGANHEDEEKIGDLFFGKELKQMPMGICIDVANGYTSNFLKMVKSIHFMYRKQLIIMAGNVVTAQRSQELFSLGIDFVKIGIGPGSVCTTRCETGIGYPQFSAVLECSKVANICADGGIQNPGDVVKSLAAGSSLVMVGGEFAGHNEGYTRKELYSGSDLSIKRNKLPYYGMASRKAQILHNGGVADYRTSEGKEVWIEPKGSVSNTISHYLGGLRSGMSYIGVDNLESLRKGYYPITFVKVNRILNNKFYD